ncbi:hypothetical protein ANCCAN_28814 [Ancylostoma caninum]|uniref:Uncharacterized protein n=1 Tax=Ancylostoma caninum TaxID=29170 RepID=A0A368F067_ANCCA|nr:hypothetical protein ANCCAN_28814 [Ancylostoma caninum]
MKCAHCKMFVRNGVNDVTQKIIEVIIIGSEGAQCRDEAAHQDKYSWNQVEHGLLHQHWTPYILANESRSAEGFFKAVGFEQLLLGW